MSTMGKPIAVDRYTADMCEKKTGRAIFARVLVEVSADQEVPMFAEALIFDVLRRFKLEYYWTPPRCSHCKIFGHTFIDCVERPKPVEEMEAGVANKPKQMGQTCTSAPNDQAFQQPKRRRRRPAQGIRISTPKVNFQYRPKAPATGKNKEPIMDVTPQHSASGDSVGTHIPHFDTHTVAPDIQTGPHTTTPGTQTSPAHRFHLSPIIETRNQFEGLCGVNTDDVSTSTVNKEVMVKKNKHEKKEASSDVWNKATLFKDWKRAYGTKVPNPYAAYAEDDDDDDDDDDEDDVLEIEDD